MYPSNWFCFRLCISVCVWCLSQNLIILLLIVLIICSRGNVCDDRSNDENEESDKALSWITSAGHFVVPSWPKPKLSQHSPSADDISIFGDNANKLNAVGPGGGVIEMYSIYLTLSSVQLSCPHLWLIYFFVKSSSTSSLTRKSSIVIIILDSVLMFLVKSLNTIFPF